MELSIRTNNFYTALSFAHQVYRANPEAVTGACITKEREDRWPLTLTLEGPHANDAYQDILERATKGPRVGDR